MRVFRNKWFDRYVRKERISDAALCGAVSRASQGMIDADLGGGVIKQRIAREGEGKSGGYRGILLYRAGERAFFVYGFAKNTQDNIGAGDLAAFKAAAGAYMAMKDEAIAELIAIKRLKEIECDG